MGRSTGQREAARDEPSGSVVTRVSRAREPGEELGSDAELVAASLRDPASFAALFDRHAQEIAQYVRARVGPDLAEDVTAETFLAAFRQRERYDVSRADARPWLYGIAVRQIGAHRRAEARYRKLIASALPDTDTHDFVERSAE